MSISRPLLILFLFVLMAVWTSGAPAQGAEWRVAPQVETPAAVSAPLPPMPADFITLHGVYARIHGDPRDQRTLFALSTHANKAVPAIAQRLGISTGPVIDVYVTDSAEGFVALQPGSPPDWADATAYPQQASIYMRSPRIRGGMASPLEQVLDHELAHVILGQAFAPRPTPRWLQEGVAQWVAGEYSPEVTHQLAQGMWGTGLIAMEDLVAGFPTGAGRARLAYAQSADLVVYIVNTSGEDGLRRLIQAYRTTETFEAAFFTAFGQWPDQMDAAWRSRLQRAPLWLDARMLEGFWWGLAGVGVFFAIFAVRRRNQKTFARWDKEEALARSLQHPPPWS